MPPALARADIGIAMAAAGSAIALETADVAIMDDDPRKVAGFIALRYQCDMVSLKECLLEKVCVVLCCGLLMWLHT